MFTTAITQHHRRQRNNKQSNRMIYIHIGDKIKLNNILVQIFCGYQMYDVVLLK